jgi:hypothetical protein
MQELYKMTKKSIPESKKYLGMISGCMALGAIADVGTCELENGHTVFITWGRNLTRLEQQWYYNHTKYEPVWVGSDNGSSELILPDSQAKKILPALV